VDAQAKMMYKLMADVISAAGHEIRLAILDYLKDGEQCVCDIADHVDANRSNVSRHLAVMLNAGLVSQRKDGLKMMYSLRTPCILNISKCVIGVLQERAQETNEILGSLK
jgi:ArsR family transcriptional regulator